MKLGITWGEPLGIITCPYLRRWVLNLKFFSIRIHHWYSSDDHRAKHDHPSGFITLVLSGSYTDVTPTGRELLKPGSIRYRAATHIHTVEVPINGCWTILIFGPQIRHWGFYVPRTNGFKFKKANKYFIEHGHHPCA